MCAEGDGEGDPPSQPRPSLSEQLMVSERGNCDGLPISRNDLHGERRREEGREGPVFMGF